MKEKTLRLSLTLAGILLCLSAVPAFSTPITGSLYANGGGLIASDGWVNLSTILSWTISELAPDNGYRWWSYEYTFQVPEKAISHIILQVTDPATEGLSDWPASDFVWGAGGAPEIQAFDTGANGNSNPGIPGPIYGMKWGGSDLILTVSFETNHQPVLGNFYAKDGIENPGGLAVFAYNTGFSDPSFGAFAYVPDSRESVLPPAVPEPGTLLLVGTGCVLAGLMRRRFRR